jgi:DNA invertase Pin-like site-specific DNA recombinase
LEVGPLARSTRDLLETMESIRESGGQFQSISEPWADSTSPAGKMIMTVFAGIAEFEAIWRIVEPLGYRGCH